VNTTGIRAFDIPLIDFPVSHFPLRGRCSLLTWIGYRQHYDGAGHCGSRAANLVAATPAPAPIVANKPEIVCRPGAASISPVLYGRSPAEGLPQWHRHEHSLPRRHQAVRLANNSIRVDSRRTDISAWDSSRDELLAAFVNHLRHPHAFPHPYALVIAPEACAGRTAGHGESVWHMVAIVNGATPSGREQVVLATPLRGS